MNTSMAAFGLNTAGEFSNAVTDCGKWVNGVDLGTRYEGTYTLETHARIGSCTPWTDWQSYDQATKDAIRSFALASMDALQVRDYAFLSPLEFTLDALVNRTGSFGRGK